MQWTLRCTHAPSYLLDTLSQLETQIVRVLWAHGPSDLRQLHRCLSLHRTVDYVAVAAAVRRLVSDELLIPEAPPNGWTYHTKVLHHGSLASLRALSVRRSAFEQPVLQAASPVLELPVALFAQVGEAPAQRALGE